MTRWVAVVLGALVVGFLLGRWVRSREQEAFEAERTAVRQWADSIRRENRKLAGDANAAQAWAISAERRAAGDRLRVAQLEVELDSLAAARPPAQPPTGSASDSARYWETRAHYAEHERDRARLTARVASDAYDTLRVAFDSQKVATARLRAIVAAQESIIRRQDSLLDEVPHACRIPVVGLPCPTIGPGAATFLHEGRVEVKPAVAVIIPLFPGGRRDAAPFARPAPSAYRPPAGVPTPGAGCSLMCPHTPYVKEQANE